MIKADHNGFVDKTRRFEYIRSVWLKYRVHAEVMRVTGYSKQLVSAARPRSLIVARNKKAFKLQDEYASRGYGPKPQGSVGETKPSDVIDTSHHGI